MALRRWRCVAACWLLALPCALGLPMIDMMTAHDEIPMLRYRLRLHAPLAVKTIILESNLSHAGYPKPLHVRDALTPDEIARHRIELINVPFGYDLEQRMINCRNSSNVKCTWLLEVAQRKFVMSMLQPTIDRTLSELGLDDVLVHMSDLDELLDIDSVRNLSLPGCVSPKLRNFVYGERCPATYPTWSRSVLFRAKSGWLARHASPSLQLRKLAKGKECNPSADWLGWHFGYFMPTERVLVRRAATTFERRVRPRWPRPHSIPSAPLFGSRLAAQIEQFCARARPFHPAHHARRGSAARDEPPREQMPRRARPALRPHVGGVRWQAAIGARLATQSSRPRRVQHERAGAREAHTRGRGGSRL